MSIDQLGPSIGQEHRRGPASNRPPPLRTPASDPTPITPVKGTYSAEVESLDRDPGIMTLDPGMRFPEN